MENKEKTVKGLKIKYNDEVYDKITYFNISNWDGKENVSFSHKKNENTMLNINCKFADIEIIKE